MFSRVMKSKKDFRKAYNAFNDTGGAGAGTGVTVEHAQGFTKTVLTFKNTPLPLIDTAATVARCALKIFDFPEGSIVIQGASANLVLTKSAAGVNADWDGDFALGTVAAAADATLTSTEANVIPSTATPQAVAGVSSAKGRSTAALLLDGTTTAVDLYLNVLVDDADQDVTTTPTNLIANGTITVLWSNMGDY